MTVEELEDMFSNMRAESHWDFDGDLLWGYFFTDPDPKKLEKARGYLQESGYRFVNIYPTDDKSTFFLHVERVEKHSPQSLSLRNGELVNLAHELGLESYDGWDVGQVMN